MTRGESILPRGPALPYSVRLHKHMILRGPERIGTLPDLLPALREPLGVDFSACPLADPDRVKIASMIVRRIPLHKRYDRDPEDEA